MCLAPTRHMTKVRLSTDSTHQVLIPRQTPEYQYPWFCFYFASLFSTMLDAAGSDMAVAASSLSSSIPPLATDPAAITVAQHHWRDDRALSLEQRS